MQDRHREDMNKQGQKERIGIKEGNIGKRGISKSRRKNLNRSPNLNSQQVHPVSR
jgi:hypothetical protein